MPFDGQITDFAPVAVPTVAPFDFDTASPDERLLELARLLEDEQAWRDTLQWDYSNTICQRAGCGTSGCALGLATVSWQRWATGESFYSDSSEGLEVQLDRACEKFALTFAEANYLFVKGEWADHLSFAQVTPGHVVTAIRQFVSNRTGA